MLPVCPEVLSKPMCERPGYFYFKLPNTCQKKVDGFTPTLLASAEKGKLIYCGVVDERAIAYINPRNLVFCKKKRLNIKNTAGTHFSTITVPELPSLSRCEPQQLQDLKRGKWIEQRGLFEEKYPKGTRVFSSIKPSYESVLYKAGKLFIQTIRTLKQDEIWFDIGAGEGKALLEYLDKYEKQASVVGIAATRVSDEAEKVLRALDAKSDRFSFYYADFVNLPESILEPLKGRVSLITDINASFRYSCNPSEVVRKIGQLLRPGGLAFIKCDSYTRINPEGLIDPKIDKTVEAGSRDLLWVWLKSLKGFDVVGENGKLFQWNIDDHFGLQVAPWAEKEVIVLRRNKEKVVVEELLACPDLRFDLQKNFESIKPKFRWVDPSESSKNLLGWIRFLNQ